MSAVITPNQTALGCFTKCSTEQAVLYTAVRGDQVYCGDDDADDDNESVDGNDYGDNNDVDNVGDDDGDDTMRTIMIQVQIDPLRLLWGHSGGARGSLPPPHPG